MQSFKKKNIYREHEMKTVISRLEKEPIDFLEIQ